VQQPEVFAVGRPVPMSRNCRRPASAVRNLTARPRNARFSRGAMRALGDFCSTRATVSRSAAKLFVPPMRAS
jgi:hypothetical protein